MIITPPSGEEVRKQLNLPAAAEKRRKYFLSADHRKDFTFEAGRLYQADFFNPYIDFSSTSKRYSPLEDAVVLIFWLEFSLRLPGFSISVLRYVNDKTHKLRYVFKHAKTGDLYFVVVMTLLFGEELEKAKRDEEKRWSKADAEVASSAGATRAGAESGTNGVAEASSARRENERPQGLSREQAYVDPLD